VRMTRQTRPFHNKVLRVLRLL